MSSKYEDLYLKAQVLNYSSNDHTTYGNHKHHKNQGPQLSRGHIISTTKISRDNNSESYY